MEAYRKVQMAKQKKKTPTKKEREAVLKALKDREQLLKVFDVWTFGVRDIWNMCLYSENRGISTLFVQCSEVQSWWKCRWEMFCVGIVYYIVYGCLNEENMIVDN